MVVLVTLYMSVGKTEGFMNICWPSTVIEPFSEKLSARLWFTTGSQKTYKEDIEKLKKSIQDAYADVAAVLGEATLSFWDILNLSVGDVIRLNTHQDDPIIIRINGRDKFRAVPGIHRGHYAAKVSEVIEMEVEE